MKGFNFENDSNIFRLNIPQIKLTNANFKFNLPEIDPNNTKPCGYSISWYLGCDETEVITGMNGRKMGTNPKKKNAWTSLKTVSSLSKRSFLRLYCNFMKFDEKKVYHEEKKKSIEYQLLNQKVRKQFFFEFPIFFYIFFFFFFGS